MPCRLYPPVTAGMVRVIRIWGRIAPAVARIAAPAPLSAETVFATERKIAIFVLRIAAPAAPTEYATSAKPMLRAPPIARFRHPAIRPTGPAIQRRYLRKTSSIAALIARSAGTLTAVPVKMPRQIGVTAIAAATVAKQHCRPDNPLVRVTPDGRKTVLTVPRIALL